MPSRAVPRSGIDRRTVRSRLTRCATARRGPPMLPSRLPSSDWVFRGQRVADELRATLVACAHDSEVGTSPRKAESPVRPAAHNVRVMVVLAVVLPEADRADYVHAPFGQRDKPAARARVGSVFRPALHVHELLHSPSVAHPSKAACKRLNRQVADLDPTGTSGDLGASSSGQGRASARTPEPTTTGTYGSDAGPSRVARLSGTTLRTTPRCLGNPVVVVSGTSWKKSRGCVPGAVTTTVGSSSGSKMPLPRSRASSASS